MTSTAKLRSLAYGLICFVVLVAASVPVQAQQDSNLTEIGFAYFPAFHTMGPMIAAESGLFEDNGLDVEMIRITSGARLIPTLLSGQAQFTVGNMTNLARLRAEGRELIFIYPVVNRMTLNMVVNDDALEREGVSADDSLEAKLAALCNMTVGYTSPNSPTDVFSRYYLREGGCDPSRSSLVSVGGGSALIAALRSGRIDAFMLTPPSPNLVELEGFGEVFIKPTAGEVPGLNDYPYTGLVVSKEFAEQNPETVLAVVQALVQAGQLIRNDSERSVEFLSAFFPEMDREVLLAGFNDMKEAIPTDGLIDPSWVENYFDLQYSLGMLEPEIEAPLEEGVLWSNEYTRQAQQAVGQ